MGINTGEITLATRNCILARTNILTFFFVILLQISINYIDFYSELLTSLVLTLFSLYLVHLSLAFSKPHYRLEYHKGDHEHSEIKYVSIERTNEVGIGDSLAKYFYMLVNNFKPMIGLILIETCIRHLLLTIMTKLLKAQSGAVSAIMKKLFRAFDEDSVPQGDQDLIVGKFFQEIQGIDQDIFDKMYYYTTLITIVVILTSVLNYFLNFMKLIVIAEIERVQMAKQNRHQVPFSVMHTFNYFFHYFLTLPSIIGHLRLCLRLFWIFLFFSTFEPYYYICLAFMYRKVTENEFKMWVVSSKLLKINEERMKENKKQMETDGNLKGAAENFEGQKENSNIIVESVAVTFHHDHDIDLGKKSQSEQSSIFRRVNQNQPQNIDNNGEGQNENKSEKQINRNENGNAHLQTSPMPRQQKVKIIKERPNKIRRFIFRPWENDIIEVKRF